MKVPRPRGILSARGIPTGEVLLPAQEASFSPILALSEYVTEIDNSTDSIVR